MKPSYAGKKRDANETAICEALRACGYDTWQLNDPVDVLVWPRAGGDFGLMEIKDGSLWLSRRELTEIQEDFFKRSEGCKRAKVETIDEALAFAQTLRRA